MSKPFDSLSPNPLRISLSNFDSKKKDHLQVLINKLGGVYNENLEYGTNILVAANALSNKYKSATLLNIPILTSKWLYKSIEMDSFLPIDIFKLPIFNEIKFGVLGFSSEEMINIKQAIESREGKVISNINDISSSQELNLILLKYSEAKTYESFLNTLKIPVLNENWFDICNQRNVFIKPENFLLGHKVPLNQNSNRKEMFHGEMKILSENKMRKYMREVESGDSGYWFLSECVIHFFNVEQDYEKILKNIVNIAGGFYINQFNISVTHLITQNYQEEDLANFKKIGSNIYVLHPLWLKDCFFYKKKISEFEYFLMPGINLQINNNENMVNSVRNPIMAKKNSFNDDSFSLMSMKFQKNKQTIDCQENKYPINIHNNEKLQRNKTASPFKKEHIEIKSFLFKNLYFFMNTSDFKEMRTYRYKILENSGKFIDNIKNNKFPIFYVLSDGLSSLKIKAQKLENVNYVSFRWVDYCLEKKQIVKNHMDLKLIHLSPLTYKMPLVCFKNSMMYVSGFPTQEKIILKNLMKVMGITLVYEKDKISHLICENEKSKKYQEILQLSRDNPDESKPYKAPKIMKAQWIFKCLTEGKSVEETEFIFKTKNN